MCPRRCTFRRSPRCCWTRLKRCGTRLLPGAPEAAGVDYESWQRQHHDSLQLNDVTKRWVRGPSETVELYPNRELIGFLASDIRSVRFGLNGTSHRGTQTRKEEGGVCAQSPSQAAADHQVYRANDPLYSVRSASPHESFFYTSAFGQQKPTTRVGEIARDCEFRQPKPNLDGVAKLPHDLSIALTFHINSHDSSYSSSSS